uniref:Uncharacterized protein n=1 Tax=Timema genevievae TaxID=629358 RepID=A0A7R9PMU3_TIMGE|nr:unnamed protein product [Timema genevievae]
MKHSSPSKVTHCEEDVGVRIAHHGNHYIHLSELDPIYQLRYGESYLLAILMPHSQQSQLQEAPKALRKIHRHQTRTQLMVGKLPIYRLELSRTQDLKTDLCPPSSVVMAMHEANEAYLIVLVENIILCFNIAIHATIMHKYFQPTQCIHDGQTNAGSMAISKYLKAFALKSSLVDQIVSVLFTCVNNNCINNHCVIVIVRESVVVSDSERECVVGSDSIMPLYTRYVVYGGLKLRDNREGVTSVVVSDSVRECGEYVCITAPVIPWAKILGSQWTGRGVTGRIRVESR